ncbi:MAG TPA: MaoC family dehydratase N-terminal domain-containing protein [Methylomirabilota bacterium]
MSATILGARVGPLRQDLDARWLMAYAAGLGERDPRYYDTLAAGGPLAHPLFAVCYEWPAAVAMRDQTIPAHLQPRSVHASHRLVIHRPPRAGDTLLITARVTEVRARRSGTLVVTRFETVNAAGAPVTTTDYGSVYRGVSLADLGETPPGGETAAGAGEAGRAKAALSEEAAPAPVVASIGWHELVEVEATRALVYTECARIWNPIHTDVAVARAAGLHDPILHGTATLALAVSRVVARALDGEPRRVAEIHARFTGMVPLPSSFTVRGRAHDGRGVAFDAVGPDGRPVLGQGVVIACNR